MKAIIEIDVPDYQIGQEVSIYFKDTMMKKAVVQEPKTGHWTIDNGSLEALYTEICECSECGMDSIGVSDYCPNCGARMIDQQESEDKK